MIGIAAFVFNFAGAVMYLVQEWQLETKRAVAGWHGRRAAYLSIIGFVTLVVTLGAGPFLPGRHGS